MRDTAGPACLPPPRTGSPATVTGPGLSATGPGAHYGGGGAPSTARTYMQAPAVPGAVQLARRITRHALEGWGSAGSRTTPR